MLCGLGVLGIKRIADSESPPSAAAETIVIPIGGCWVVCFADHFVAVGVSGDLKRLRLVWTFFFFLIIRLVWTSIIQVLRYLRYI